MRMVWALGTVNLKPGVLRLFEWTKDFNMHKQRNTHAQVWIRLLELPQEYWMDRTLRGIASAVGTPLLIDNATSNHIYGHYARILVDIDFSKKLFHEITVEREGYAFIVEVAYEWLPYFCTHCQTIGHDVLACRWLYPRVEKNAHKETIVQGKKSVPIKKHNWVPIKDNPSDIGSSLSFEAPHKIVDITVPVMEAQNNLAHQQETTEAEIQQLITIDEDIMQQSDIVDAEGVHHNLEDEPLEIGETIAGNVDTTMNIPTPTAAKVNPSSMPLNNVADNVARWSHGPILTPVADVDVSSIRADPNATLDPTLQKDLDFMKTWLDKAAVNEDVPFSPVLSKSQKKKLKQQVKASYQTRSQGPLPTSQ